MNEHRTRSRTVLSIPVLLLVAFSPAPSAAVDELIDLGLYGRLLERHTRSVTEAVGTVVDYRALRDSEDWTRLVVQIESARPSGASRDERLAFWINAYNILTIDLVRKHYPVDGIKDIGSLFSPVWNVEVATIEGRALSLGQIEHDILRKMDEPRIHAAIVCASISCPPLARAPFRPSHIEADLSTAMRLFLSNRDKGAAIDRDGGAIILSKIFDWFEEDFAKRGGVLDTVERFLQPREARWLRMNRATAKIRYFSYDWSLNDWTRAP